MLTPAPSIDHRSARLRFLALTALVATFSLLYFYSRPFVDLVGIWPSDESLSHGMAS